MGVGLFFDVHVDHAIAGQLRLRNVDVVTAQEAGVALLADELLLEYATKMARPVVTHDIRFHAMAQRWQSEGRAYCGLIFAHLLHVPLGRCVHDLEVIAKATDPEDWMRTVL